MFHALLVSPLEADLHALQELCPQTNWKLDLARSIAEARSWMVRLGTPPIIICERDLPDGNWKLLFHEAETMPHPPRFVVCSRLADEYLWAGSAESRRFRRAGQTFRSPGGQPRSRVCLRLLASPMGRKPVRAFRSAAAANAVARAAS